MGRNDRIFVLWTVIYLAIYLPFFFTMIAIGPSERFFVSVIGPLHFLGMAQNIIAFALTIRDLYLRSFPRENQKVTWALLIVCTGGIGWLVYIFKHALKPRPNICRPMEPLPC